MAEAEGQSKGRFRRWLDTRREAQRRGAEITARAKAVRKRDADRRSRRRIGPGGDGGGPFGGL